MCTVGGTLGPGLGNAGLKNSDQKKFAETQGHLLNSKSVHTLLLLRAPQEILVPQVLLAHQGLASTCLLSLVCLILRRIRTPCGT